MFIVCIIRNKSTISISTVSLVTVLPLTSLDSWITVEILTVRARQKFRVLGLDVFIEFTEDLEFIQTVIKLTKTGINN